MAPRDTTLDKMQQRATTTVPEGEPIIPNGPTATTQDTQEFKSAANSMGYSVEFGKPAAVTKPTLGEVHLTPRQTVGELSDEFLHVWNNSQNRRGAYLTGEKQFDHMRLARTLRISGSSSDRLFHQLELENYTEYLRKSGETIPGFVWRTFSGLELLKPPAEAGRAVQVGPGPGPLKPPAEESIYPVRRGNNEPNPIQEPRIELWRGTAEGVASLEHSETDPHDFKDGLYLTDELWLADEYARLRSTPQNRPIVWRATLSRSELGRILDLRSGVVAQQWNAYLKMPSYPNGPAYEDLIRLANQNYWPIFDEFLSRTSRNLGDYDTIIGPEFVRQGWQYCIRNPAIQQKIQSRFVEVDTTPLWVRVLDASGRHIDVNINDPRNAEENRRYVEERLREQKGSERIESEPVPAPGGPVTPPGINGAPGWLALLFLAIEVTRIALETTQAIKNAPSDLQLKLERPLRKARFWKDFGVHASVLAVALRDGAKALGNSQERAKGRIIYGLTPAAFQKLSAKDVDFFLGFVDNFGTPKPESNALEQKLTTFIQYMRFLHQGWKRGVEAILPPSNDVNLPLARMHRWYVVTQRPQSPGSTNLIEEYYSLDVVLARIWKKLIDKENAAIPRRKYADVPAASWTLHGNDLGIRSEKVLRFRPSSDYGVYSTFVYAGDATPRQWASKKDWGDIMPKFYQVGNDDIGFPFLMDKALLVTGADADTNAFLYGVLAEHDDDALVSTYEPTLEVDSRGAPKEWVNVPVVYVDADSVEAASR